MKTKEEQFEVLIPNVGDTGVAERVTVTILLEWDEELKEWLLTPQAHEIIEDTKARHMGLLLPAQLKELRERYDCTQKEMAELFQVGEKSWTRWESGGQRPSRSINVLIRALYEGEISINYLLRLAGKPPKFLADGFVQYFSKFLDSAPNAYLHAGKNHFAAPVFDSAGPEETEFWQRLGIVKKLEGSFGSLKSRGRHLEKESECEELKPRFDFAA